MADDEVG